MSTDYGIHCVDCNFCIVAECRREYMQYFLAHVHQFATLHNLVQKLDIDTIGAWWCRSGYQLEKLMEFAYVHHEHKLVIIDEYQANYLPLWIYRNEKGDSDGK